MVEMGGLVRSFATEQRLLPRANRVSPGVRKGARPFGAQPVLYRHNKNRTETRSAFVVEMGGLEPPYHSLGLTPSTRLVCD